MGCHSNKAHTNWLRTCVLVLRQAGNMEVFLFFARKYWSCFVCTVQNTCMAHETNKSCVSMYVERQHIPQHFTVPCSPSHNVQCQTSARQGVMGQAEKENSVAYFEQNFNQYDSCLIWFSDLSCLSEHESSLLSDSSSLLTTVGVFLCCTNFLFGSHWPYSFHSPFLCCLCPHHLLSSHLSSSLLSLCPSSLLSFISSFFHPPLPSPTLFTLILNSTYVLSCLFIPLSSSALVKPFQALLLFSALLWSISSLHVRRVIAPGQFPPAAVPTAAVPTYPAGWLCTAGLQSELLCWDPPKREMPRLGTSGSCHDAGMDTPVGSECWSHLATAPRCPTPQWAAHKAPGSGGWIAAALQWCWLCCLQ